MNDQFFNAESDRIQRLINEAKKRDLAERYGAVFGETSEPVPADVESDWLNYVEDYERQFADAKTVTVKEYLGNPVFTPLQEVAAGNLESELNNVIELYSAKNIAIDFPDEISDEDAYHFLTAELPDKEMNDIKIERMVTHFIYEEFHPVPEHQAEMTADCFIFNVFSGDVECALRMYNKEELYDRDGKTSNHETIRLRLASFLQQYSLITKHNFRFESCSSEDDYFTVLMRGSWSGLLKKSLKMIVHEGACRIRMKKTDDWNYDIVQADIPGIEL